MTNTFDEDLKTLLIDLELRCRTARESQFETAEYWDSWNLRLGLAAVLSGVIGGVSATGTAAWGTSLAVPIAAVLSTLAGLLAAANSFLKPADRVVAHKRAGDGWSILRDHIVGVLKLDCDLPHDKLREKIGVLLAEKEEVTKTSPVIPSKIYHRVKNQIKAESGAPVSSSPIRSK
jgi:hypothetical protein